MEGNTTVTVSDATLRSLVVTPEAASLPKGDSLQYRADGTYSDNSSKNVTDTVTWSSSASATASISNASGEKGKATGIALGTANIKAALDGVEDITGVTVTDAALKSIAVAPNAPSIAAGTTLQFTATGTYTDTTAENPPKDITASVVWNSGTTSVATISNASGEKGKATSTTKGSTAITATSGSISSPSATLTVTDAVPVSIEVTPANATVPKGGNRQYTATVLFSDGRSRNQTGDVTWDSTTATVASISNAAGSQGNVSTLTVGTTNIRATLGSINGMTGLTVSPATLQGITVTAVRTSLPVGYKVNYVATGNYSDGSSGTVITNDVSWTTSNSAVANVSNTAGSKGEVTTVALGTTAINATMNGVTGTRNITVNNATLNSIAVTPQDGETTRGEDLQFTAVASFSDSTTYDVTRQVLWAEDSMGAFVTIDQTGLATGGNLPGTATISATKGTVSGEADVTNSPF